MKQLLLDLNAPASPSLDTFVTGQNAELLALLRRVAQGVVSDLGERFIYLWGEEGAGKTHLLHALSHSYVTTDAIVVPNASDMCDAPNGVVYLNTDSDEAAFAYQPAIKLYLLDDVAALSPSVQIAAFTLFNLVREQGGTLVVTGPQAPAALTVREDLRTRLGWGLIYQLHGLSDAEKIAALEQAAVARGLVLSGGVLPYLLTHYQRDMPSLMTMLDALDRYSLETKRPITLPLLKELTRNDEPCSI